MKKLALAALLAITPVTFAEVRRSSKTIQQLKAEINELKAKMQGEMAEASQSSIAQKIGGY